MWPFKEKIVYKIKRQHGQLPRRSFYAGLVDRLTNSFTGVSMSVNESLKSSLEMMRQRSRQLVHDNDYGKKYINMVKTNVVGANGIKLQSKSKGSNGLPDKLDNDAIEKAWKDWSHMDNCTVTGKLSLLDTQRIAVSAVATDGECLIRIVKGKSYKYGVALQLIEADRLDTRFNESSFDGSRVVMGVELNEFEVPTAYYILTTHPGEATHTDNKTAKKYVKIPANEIIHLFMPERISQARGIPWMHASIRRLDMVGGYEEAELTAARVGASKGGFYYTETGEEYTGTDIDTDGSVVQDLEPGTFEQLPNGMKFQQYDPQHPTGAYNYFLKGTLKGAAAGLNVSYTGYTGDLEAVNYSSIRAGLIDERENWRVIQTWFIEHCMQRIYKEWLVAALSRGLIINDVGAVLPLSNKEKFMDVKWQARGWAWVDPMKDAQANELSVKNGHMTNSEVVSSQGKDLEEIYEALAWERDLAKSYGLEFDKKEVTKNDTASKDVKKTN